MRAMRKTVWALLSGLCLTGCASIVGGGSSQAVSIQSTPSPASYQVRSSSGFQIDGRTPGTERLPRKNEYQVRISLEGYETQDVVLTKGTNGWIWGNLLIGWIVGFAIDFITGAAYKLEPEMVQVTLETEEAETYAVVRLLTNDQRVLSERRLLMVPSG